MATIINTPGTDTGNSTGGWIVALVAIFLLVLGGVWFWNMQNDAQVQGTEDERNANVIIPPPVNNYNTTLNSTTTINNSTSTRR